MSFWRRGALYLLFLLSVIGTQMPVVGLHGLRAYLVVVLCAGFITATAYRTQAVWLSSSNNFFLLLGGGWIVWGAIGCLWSRDLGSALKEVVDVAFGVLIAISMRVLSFKQVKSVFFDDVIRAWVFAFLVAAVVGVWELYSGSHLPSSYIEQSADYQLESVWVMSTFGNPNNYAAFLVLCVPFLLFRLFRFPGFSKKVFPLFFLMLSIVLVALTGSRGGVAVIFLIILGAVFARMGFVVGAGVMVAFVFLMVFSFDYFYMGSVDDLSIFNKFFFIENSFGEGHSFGERLGLYGNALYMMAMSYGFGVGPHQFENYIFEPGMLYRVSIPNPHAFLFEIGSQYGVVVLGCFLYWIFFIFKVNFKLWRFCGRDSSDRLLGLCGMLSIFGYVIASFESSSYISQPTNWLFLGTALCFSDYSIDALSRVKKFFGQKNKNF